MRGTALMVAAGLAIAIGLAHSYLGERYILIRLFRRELPRLFGSDWFTKRTLRFAWHLTSVAWWGFAVLLLMAVDGEGPGADEALWVTSGVFGVSGLVSLIASRGRHLSWVVFLAIALLAVGAARGSADVEDSGPVADVVSVQATESDGGFVFAVGIASPDTGCERYANWWEVVGLDGDLLYRRILTHSHIDEQPFVRSGGPVSVGATTMVWVRAYMHPSGYGGTAFKGSVAEGFAPGSPKPGFAAGLVRREPLPDGCTG